MRFTSAKNQPLTLEKVQSIAPSVFADRPWGGVSDRYTFIPTISVVESLLSEGWNIMAAKQQATRIEGKEEFTRHILRFRRPGNDLVVGDVFPEIVLMNSHDRGSAYQMHAGMFRLACSNGLIVDDSTFARLSIRHSGKAIDDVRRGADEIMTEVPRILGSVHEMQTIELTRDERGVLARAAFSLKFDESVPLDPSKLLEHRRYGDEKTDLWTTFNVVEENLTKGGLRYVIPAGRDENGQYVPRRRQRTREVKSIQEDTKLNKALWTLAEEMKKLKLAA